ncbi:MFS transporter [Paracerasibacillus soli]|uniref:MFS transporter n=2 Tax=Paracerasibacillus soli TaxID=480284 RepID=A0ABU5CQ59_9BACI|nr:MFS transporter [Virgibacillus soli]MDY0407954.1 MFS transporter [Virgibacillus soli]
MNHQPNNLGFHISDRIQGDKHISININNVIACIHKGRLILIMSRMLKPTIISIAMATVMAGAAISPALGLIAAQFPDADPVMIKLVLTAPSLFIIPFSFLSSYLTKKISKRSIVLWGLAIYILTGVGAQFTNSIEMLLAFRFLLGAGVGLVMPLSFTLISDHFKGKEQVKMMGYNTAFSNVGGIVTMLLAGYLASFNWRVPFNVYWIGLIIFVLVFLYLPKNKPIKPLDGEAKKGIPLSVYGLALAACVIMMVYYAVATNMALYLEQNHLGNSKVAGLVMSFTTVGGMITSIILVRLQDLFKSYIMLVSLLVMGIAFGLLSISNSIIVVLVSVCLIGFGQGVIFPLINVKTLNSVDPSITDRVIAIVSSLIYIGQFLSPIVFDSISRLAGIPTIRFQYTVIAAGLIISVVIMMLVKFAISKGKTAVKQA